MVSDNNCHGGLNSLKKVDIFFLCLFFPLSPIPSLSTENRAKLHIVSITLFKQTLLFDFVLFVLLFNNISVRNLILENFSVKCM